MRPAPARRHRSIRLAAILLLAVMLLMRVGPMCEAMAQSRPVEGMAAMPCHQAPAPAKQAFADPLCAVGCCALLSSHPLSLAPVIAPARRTVPAPAMELHGLWQHPEVPPPRIA